MVLELDSPVETLVEIEVEEEPIPESTEQIFFEPEIIIEEEIEVTPEIVEEVETERIVVIKGASFTRQFMIGVIFATTFFCFFGLVFQSGKCVFNKFKKPKLD